MIEKVLDFYTTSSKDITGKTKIMVCFHETEPELFIQYARPELMKFCDNAALLYPHDQIGLVDNEKYQNLIIDLVSEMNGLFICVTKKLLDSPNSYAKSLINTAVDSNIPILPYFCEPDLFRSWNEYLEYQGIDPFSNDPTQISYNIKIANWIEHITPVSKDIVDNIWKSFNSKIFLSYRKLDRKYINTIMKNIHDDARTNSLSFTGVWYDEALTPEGKFWDIIKQQIDTCNLAIMLITPHTFEHADDGSDNFVISSEYPALEKSGKTIIGILTHDADKILARSVFPAIKNYVFIEEALELRQLILSAISEDAQTVKMTGDNLYNTALAYLNGIGAEISIDNAVYLLNEAVKNDNHTDARRKLIDIHFSEDERAKGEDGYFDTKLGGNMQLEIIVSAMSALDADSSTDNICNVFNEYIILIRLYKSCADQESLKRALDIAIICMDWIHDFEKKSSFDELFQKFSGYVNIEIGEIQYMRHIFRDKNAQWREPGAIWYLALGIPLLQQFIDENDSSTDDLHLIMKAYDILADSYYRQGSFTKQCSTLLDKTNFAKSYTQNEMDRAQILARADSYFKLGEAYMMCSLSDIPKAVETFAKVRVLLDDAQNLLDDIQITKRWVHFYKAFGNTMLCLMDISKTNEERSKWYQSALSELDNGILTLDIYLSSHNKSNEVALAKYLYGVMLLNIFRAHRVNNDSDSKLLDQAMNCIGPYAEGSSDYDVMHNLYKLQLEILSNIISVIFENPSEADADDIYQTLRWIDSKTNEIEKDTRQHNDYWLAIDRLEFYSMKAGLLLNTIKLNNPSIPINTIIRELRDTLYIAESHGRNLLKNASSEPDRVLLGALWQLSIRQCKFYEYIGDEASMYEAIQKSGELAELIKNSCRNDYMC
ncbi:MAG: hypothetical protein Q4D29_04555 [Lachnospiraceae bacterium]|nr:hypothetical protein [Lachnospiraceae bacterium]